MSFYTTHAPSKFENWIGEQVIKKGRESGYS